MSTDTQKVTLRRIAWGMFWLLLAITVLGASVPHFPLFVWVLISAVAIGIGSLARFFLWRIGGKL